MKKIISVLLVLFILAPVFSRDFVLYEESCLSENSYNDKLSLDTFTIYYNSDMEVTYISRNGGFIMFSEDSLESIRTALSKYFEWEKIAVDKKTTIEKELPLSTTVAVAWSNYADEPCLGKGEMSYVFFSQTTVNHQLVIELPRVSSLMGDSSSYKMDSIYLTKSMVETLKEDLSKEALNKKLEEVKKQEDLESLFN